ncbi:sensor histidine kinase [Ornithinimicrobium sufpigmenti]|uniref:sensor histidine kinase n=1 Tax=Ornithinimicrobium sufpigmenti TaxID=2508882 RepID=UPI0015E1AB06|nr:MULTISPECIES: sensor histidine kinase [unclassified Ornithinimicrobium]
MSSTVLPASGGQTPYAAPGLPMQGPPALPRLTGPAEGWDGQEDSAPGAPDASSAPPNPQGTASWRRRSVTALWSVAHVLTSLFTAIVAIVLVSIAIGGFFSLPAVGVGVLLLTPAIWGAWGLARLERHRIAAFLGIDIGDPPPSSAPPWLRTLGLDQPRLKSLGWAGLHALWGLVSASLLLALAAQAFILASLPLWGWSVPHVWVLWAIPVSTGPLSLGVLCGLGLGLLVLLPAAARGLAGVDVALARWLIGSDPQTQLRAMSQRVQTLTTTRTETLDSVEAERRRIERDLHDGPQQRLVSVAMNLGLARDALDRNPDDPAAARLVRDLLDEAHASSKEAITEMRQVARGIVPPILADRGLDAAVSALADRSPVPVSVSSRLPGGRLEPTVEAIAYFCISEALTNVAKHSGASRATVELGTARGLDGDLLAVTITDDGGGGAVVGAGSGLTGLRQRVAAVDGQVHVHSPVGTGTTVAITLPLSLAGGAR